MNNTKEIMVFVLQDGTEIVAEAEFHKELGAYTLFKPFKLFTFAVVVGIDPHTRQPQVAINTQPMPAFHATGLTRHTILEKSFLVAPTLAPQHLKAMWMTLTSGIQVAGGPAPSGIVTP